MLSLNIEAVTAEFCLDHAAFTAFMEYEDRSGQNAESLVEAFEDSYLGTFDSLEDWAEDYLENTGGLESMPENLRRYFDFEAFARDCRLNGDIYEVTTPEGLAVFHSH